MSPATGIWSVSVTGGVCSSETGSKQQPFWSLFGHFAEPSNRLNSTDCAQARAELASRVRAAELFRGRVTY